MADAAQRLLVTGAGGFAAAALLPLVRRRHPDWVITPTDLEPRTEGGAPLDVADAAAVDRLVEALKPTLVAHLAAISTLGAANADRRRTWNVNFGGALNLAESLRKHCPSSRMLFVSSAQVYGRSLDAGRPLAEDAPLHPTNVYAASKAAGEVLMQQCGFEGQSTVIARPFNHTGAGQSPAFAIPAFAAQIARIERGLQSPEILVGNLDDERDILDVRDVVSAYLLLLERQDLEAGRAFNIASGTVRRMGDVLEALLSRARTPISVKVDPARLRLGGPSIVAGDAGGLRALGWAPEVPFGETLDSVLEAQRGMLSKAG